VPSIAAAVAAIQATGTSSVFRNSFTNWFGFFKRGCEFGPVKTFWFSLVTKRTNYFILSIGSIEINWTLFE
jgi:hypothetical protein